MASQRAIAAAWRRAASARQRRSIIARRGGARRGASNAIGVAAWHRHIEKYQHLCGNSMASKSAGVAWRRKQLAAVRRGDAVGVINGIYLAKWRQWRNGDGGALA